MSAPRERDSELCNISEFADFNPSHCSSSKDDSVPKQWQLAIAGCWHPPVDCQGAPAQGQMCIICLCPRCGSMMHLVRFVPGPDVIPGNFGVNPGRCCNTELDISGSWVAGYPIIFMVSHSQLRPSLEAELFGASASVASLRKLGCQTDSLWSEGGSVEDKARGRHQGEAYAGLEPREESAFNSPEEAARESHSTPFRGSGKCQAFSHHGHVDLGLRRTRPDRNLRGQRVPVGQGDPGAQ